MVFLSLNLDLAENRERLDGFVVVSNKIDHPVPTLSQLLCVHRFQVRPILPANSNNPPKTCHAARVPNRKQKFYKTCTALHHLHCGKMQQWCSQGIQAEEEPVHREKIRF